MKRRNPRAISLVALSAALMFTLQAHSISHAASLAAKGRAGQAAGKCSRVCFRSPEYYRLMLPSLVKQINYGEANVIIGGYNFNNPVNVASCLNAVLLALDGNGDSVLAVFNQQYVAAQLSLVSSKSGPARVDALWSNLSCYDLEGEETLTNGFRLSGNSMLKDLFEQARSAILEHRDQDLVVLAAFFSLLNGDDVSGKCGDSGDDSNEAVDENGIPFFPSFKGNETTQVVRGGAPIPFIPFPVIDPETGNPVSKDTLIRVPDATTGAPVMVRAGDYYDTINRTEAALNEIGHSLKGGGDQNDPIQISTGKPSCGRLSPCPTPDPFSQSRGTNPKEFGFLLGEMSSFGLQFTGKLGTRPTKITTSQPPDEIGVEGNTKITAYVFGQPFDVFKLEPKFTTRLTPSEAINKSNFTPVLTLPVLGVVGLPKFPEGKDTFKQPFGKGPISRIDFAIGPVPMTLVISLSGDAGFDYGYNTLPFGVKGEITPFANANLGVLASTNLPFINAGVNADLLLLGAKLPLTGQATLDLQKKCIVPSLTGEVNITYLKGEVTALLKITTPKWNGPSIAEIVSLPKDLTNSVRACLQNPADFAKAIGKEVKEAACKSPAGKVVEFLGKFKKELNVCKKPKSKSSGCKVPDQFKNLANPVEFKEKVLSTVIYRSLFGRTFTGTLLR